MLYTRKRAGCSLCEEGVHGLREILLADQSNWRRSVEIVLHDKVGNNIRQYGCTLSEYIPERERIYKGFLPLLGVWGSFWPKTTDIISLTENIVVGRPLVIAVVDLTSKKVKERVVSLYPVAHILEK